MAELLPVSEHLNCKNCGAERKFALNVRHTTTPYCRSCAQNLSARCLNRKTRICQKCQKEFFPTKSSKVKVYCSVECRPKSFEKPCGGCGKTIKVKPALANRKNFCSFECRNKSYENKVDFECNQCGKVCKLIPYLQEHKKYCSNKCRNIARQKRDIVTCKTCKKDFLFATYADRKFCSKKCSNEGKIVNPHTSENSKLCPSCKKDLPLSEYHNSKLKYKGRSQLCKTCVNNGLKKSRLKSQYGMTFEQLNEMKEKQNHCCLVCKQQTEKLVIDHCHKSGKVRGLLCNQCNMGIGLFKDNSEYLKGAISYLSQF
jgi:hypothetical protein